MVFSIVDVNIEGSAIFRFNVKVYVFALSWSIIVNVKAMVTSRANAYGLQLFVRV